ncbi:unnamed protein product [Spirodela intermedia]|uniref:VQ domain-containing protein n=1 Tax=Spirodela intermedia TaxID=51605 RepID=A0A7I8J2N7_SPIIN|nr:unnamed protein product [Spirodela intermedia]CAA6664408.1 unnamed protein product [Spirodela intermedia]
MDSGNSGSIQSSSGGGGGGDDDYDHPVDSIASFLSPSSGASFSSLYHHLDPLSGYLDTLLPPPPAASNSVLHPDLSWERSLSAQPLLGTSSPPPPPPSLPSAVLQSAAAAAAIPPASSRGSKKRSRASRRVPITVLTTDTSNFRAMVQEFTGGPSPSFFPPLRPALLSGADMADAPPRCLLQPFPQKLPFFCSSSSSPSSATPATLDKAGPPRTVSAATAPSTSMMITNATSFPPGPADQPKNLLNMANFQFLHHRTSGKYDPPTMASIAPRDPRREPRRWHSRRRRRRELTLPPAMLTRLRALFQPYRRLRRR